MTAMHLYCDVMSLCKFGALKKLFVPGIVASTIKYMYDAEKS